MGRKIQPTTNSKIDDLIVKIEKQFLALDARVESLRGDLKLLREIHEAKVVYLGKHSQKNLLKGAKLPTLIMDILKRQNAPITRRELRDCLVEDMGVPIERLGKGAAYFYVVLNRLEKNNQIYREGDEISVMIGV